MTITLIAVAIAVSLIVIIRSYGGYLLNRWMPKDNMRQGDVIHIYLNNEYNRSATISKVEGSSIVIYDRLPLPMSYRGKFYAAGTDLTDNIQYLYMRKRRYIIPCRIIERFRRRFGLDQHMENLPVDADTDNGGNGESSGNDPEEKNDDDEV